MCQSTIQSCYYLTAPSLCSKDVSLDISDFLNKCWKIILHKNKTSQKWTRWTRRKKSHPNLISNPKNRSPDDWNGRVRCNSLSLRDFRKYSVLRPKSKTTTKHIEKNVWLTEYLKYRCLLIASSNDGKAWLDDMVVVESRCRKSESE